MLLQRSRASLIIFAVILGVSVATVQPANAARTTTTFNFSGAFAEAYYSQVTACTEVYAYNFGTTGRATISRSGSQRNVDVGLSFSTSDYCGELPSFGFYECSTNSGAVDIDRRLSGATISATLTCTNTNTGGPPTCQVSKTETLQGIGDVSTSSYHSVYRTDTQMIATRFRGQFREAQVTSASITGCGVSLTAQDADFARLESTTSGTVVISSL